MLFFFSYASDIYFSRCRRFRRCHIAAYFSLCCFFAAMLPFAAAAAAADAHMLISPFRFEI